VLDPRRIVAFHVGDQAHMRLATLALVTALVEVAAWAAAPKGVGDASSSISEGFATRDDSLYQCPAADSIDAFLTSGDGAGSVESALARLHGAKSHSDPDATPCAIIAAGWWNYELCWDRYLRQFHTDPQTQRISAEFFLGLGPRALDASDRIVGRLSRYVDGDRSVLQQVRSIRTSDAWKVAEATGTAFRSQLQLGSGQLFCSAWLDAKARQQQFASSTTGPARSHTSENQARMIPSAVQGNPVVTLYSGGTVCDVTKRPRRTLVVLACDHQDSKYIGFNVSEDSPCSYVAYVYGAAVCSLLREKQIPDIGMNVDSAIHVLQDKPRRQVSKAATPTPTPEFASAPATHDGSQLPSEGAISEPISEARISAKPSRYTLGRESRADSCAEKECSPDPYPDAPGSSDDPADPPRNSVEELYEGSLIFSL
jgi:hypothetical protein